MARRPSITMGRRPMSALIASGVALIGCTFFFISVLSAPIKKTVCFANVRTAEGDKVVDFGLFGACWWAHRGFPYMCTSRKLGWTLDTARLGGHFFPSRVQVKLLKLSRGLISDVVVLVFVGLSSSLWTIRWMTNMRVFRIPAIIFYILSIPASLIAWGHNIATAIFVRNMMREFTGGEYVGTYGNAVWLTLAGTIWLILGLPFQFSAAKWCCFRDDPEALGAGRAKDVSWSQHGSRSSLGRLPSVDSPALFEKRRD